MWFGDLYIGLQEVLIGTQILFYLGTLTIIVLTYFNARKTLLSPAHTEYHKNVITRLKEISEELDSEFDPDSSNYWAYGTPMKEAVDRINAKFRAKKEEIIKRGEWREGPYLASTRYQKLRHLARSVKADPFMPHHIRESIVDTLNARADVLFDTELEVLQDYEQALAKQKDLVNFYKEDIDKNWSWVFAHVRDRLDNKGFGPRQAEEKVDEMRLEIQRYLESFSPHQ
jgi:hypothetical protein